MISFRLVTGNLCQELYSSGLTGIQHADVVTHLFQAHVDVGHHHECTG